MNRSGFIILIIVVLLCNYTLLNAAEEDLVPYKKHSITILWENDFLNFMKSDRYYTNGSRIGWTSKPTSTNHKGGSLDYDMVKKFIQNICKINKFKYITTMFDYYALNSKFPDIKNPSINNMIYIKG